MTDPSLELLAAALRFTRAAQKLVEGEESAQSVSWAVGALLEAEQSRKAELAERVA